MPFLTLFLPRSGNPFLINTYRVAFLMVLIGTLFTGCSKREETFAQLSDLDGGKLFAVPSGTVADKLVLTRFSDATFSYYNSIHDCALAVQEGKADACSYDKPVLQNLAAKMKGLVVMDELIMDDQYGFAVKQSNTALKRGIDETLNQLKSDGTYAAMQQRWFPKAGEPGPMPEFPTVATNDVLRFGTAAVTEPMAYVGANQQVIGFDVEFAAHIARRLGKRLEVINMEFGALIPALLAGKVDVIGAGMSITEERAKSVLFSASYYPSGIAVMVKAPAKTNTLSSLDDIADKRIGVLLGSIHENYAREHQPNATLLQYQAISDLLTALKHNKIDAAYYDQEGLKDALAKNSDVGVLVEQVFAVDIGAAFNQDKDALRTQFNEFLRQIRADGTYDAMVTRWMKEDNQDLPAIKTGAGKGELRVGLVGDVGLPFTALKDGRLVGFDVELPMRFAAWLGKKFVPVDIQFGSMLASISTNKVDFATCSMMITEEREKQVDFSDAYFQSGVSVIALKKRMKLASAPIFKRLDDVSDKTIGVLSGTIHDAYIREHYPKATVKQFTQSPDLFLALQTHKVDAVMTTLSALKVVIKENPDIAILKDTVFTMPLGVGFNKNNQGLRTRFNAFLKAINTDGTMDDMLKRWFEGDPLKAKMPTFAQPETGKTLHAAVSVNDLPYVSFANGTFVGFDVELLQRFAHSEDCRLDVQVIDFNGLIMALSGGKVDLIADGIAITDERKQSIDFSDPYAYFPTSVAVRSADMAGFSGDKDTLRRPSLLKRFADGFTNNLLLEDRYKLILDGLLVTLLISLFSAFFGTLLGGLVCFLRMSKHRFWSGTAKTYIALLRGTPVLVLLMIIFYVVFASVNINPVVVAVIAFGLNFAAYVSEMFRTSIESVDKGQFEAGIAGGFTKVGTFTHIILPQAVRRVLPVYKGEFISLVKMTSIVGYIAVQDVTRASDIIRSRTFDAFFPLLVATVIYLLLAWLLTWLLDRVEISVDPKQRRARALKMGTRFSKVTQ